MNRERLTKLADFLDTVPEPAFNIDRWQGSCGTVACAVGWATKIPEFIEAGFKMMNMGSYYESVPVFENRFRWNAVTEFFDINYEQAMYLFSGFKYDMPGWQVTPAMVAERIREVLAK